MPFASSIALLGPGAIGTTIAAALHEVGRTPVICGRTARSSLVLHVDGGEIAVPGPVKDDPRAIHAPFDLVFVSVKSTQIAASAAWLSVLCHEKTVVCVLQNGVEQVKNLTPYVAGATILPSVVWFPAVRKPDGDVWLGGEPRLTLPDTSGARLVVDALQGSRCAIDVSSDFITLAWRKLLHNAVAGLMVLTGRRMGMYSREDIAALSRCYLAECLAVARAEGATLSDNVPEEILQGLQAAPVDRGTSILADRLAGLPLEWDCRNGVVQRLGRLHGIATPVSDVVVPLLAASSDVAG